jgi:galactitol-specific phosphotransferase system IIB component
MNGKHKINLQEREIISTPLFKVDSNAAAGEAAPNLYKKLISDAKKVYNIPGALYIASEVMAFDIPSENYKTVYMDNDAKKFMKTFTAPQPIPLLYNHADQTDNFFGSSGEPPRVAGRVLSQAVAPGMFNTPSAFAGEVVTDPETIDRIYNLMDYTQSISIMPKQYICEVCGIDATSEDCPHMPGQKIVNDKGKETRVVWKLIPNYAVEFSFVLVPGYRNARIVAMEQNGLSGAPTTHGKALFSYNKKEGMITVPDSYNALPNPIEGYQPRPQKTEDDESHVNINNNNSLEGEEEMKIEEVVTSMNSAVAAMTTLATQVAENNKAQADIIAAVKTTVDTIAKNNAPVVTEPKTEPAPTAAPVTPAPAVAPEQNALIAEEVKAKVAELEASVTTLVEQNKAILESIKGLTPVPTEPAAPAAAPAAPAVPDTNAAPVTELPPKVVPTAAGDGSGIQEPKKVNFGSYHKGILGSL